MFPMHVRSHEDDDAGKNSDDDSDGSNGGRWKVKVGLGPDSDDDEFSNFLSGDVLSPSFKSHRQKLDDEKAAKVTA